MTASLNLRERIEDYSSADYEREPEGYFFNEITGEYHEQRKAGDRYTGPRMKGCFLEHDALAKMLTLRRMLVAKRKEEGPITDWQWERMLASRRHHYDLQRMRAYRPVSQLVLVDILARSESAERKTNALVAAMRGAA